MNKHSLINAGPDIIIKSYQSVRSLQWIAFVAIYELTCQQRDANEQIKRLHGPTVVHVPTRTSESLSSLQDLFALHVKIHLLALRVYFT